MSRAGARGLTEVIDMSANERIENSLDTGSILRHARVFGIKTMTVVVTASMLLSGLPTAAIAEGLEEAGVIAAQSETEASTQDTNITVDEDTTATDGSDAAAESSDQQDNSAAQNTPASEEQTATEADVALDLGSAYITYNGQDIALPSTKVTVPTAKDFTFSVAANTGFDLTAVKLTVNGSESELTADANGDYTVTAAQVAAGASLKLETEEQAAEAAASNNAIAITSLEDEGEDEADQTANDQSDANAIAVVSDFDGSITGNDTLEVGKFAVYTAEGFSGTVLWTTSDDSIAKVEQNGVVTAVATGTVTITAQSGDETETASKKITVVEPSSASGYEATITSTIENAEVAYFAWHDTSDTSSISFGKATGTVIISDYTTRNKPGYVVFFVKPNSNHIVTGLGASGNGDIYAVDATSWGNINGYPNIAQVMAAAKAAGYVAAFGWSRSARQSLTADFTISAKSPDMTVTAVSDRTTGVKAGDVLTFTVTITPQTTGSGKDSVESVLVNSADVNGTKVTVESITGNTDGTFTGTVHYTATEDDVARGKVVLTVEATSTYKGAYTITSGDIASSATVTKEAECECLIAPASQVDYKFVSGTSGKSLPGAINNYLPSDHSSYDAGETVTAIDPSKTVYEDSDHDGYWTFTGWDKDSAEAGREGETIVFTGTWTFTQYSKYQVKYVDAAGKELLSADTFSGVKVGQKVQVSDIEKPSIKGYSYSTSNPKKELEIVEDVEDGSNNVITLTYAKKTGKAGYYLVLKDAEWTAPDETTRETEKPKWYYDYGFAKGDTFVVTDSEPSADNHVFIGWLDKARGKQPAAIRKAGDTVTYCYSDDQTYTLDALWASLSATGEDVTYDGKSHTVTVDVSINEGTGLNPDYAEQAKKLITPGDVEYSTDGGATWSKDKPSFTNAGSYTVKVRQNVTVGDKTTPLTAEATVKIAQKEYWVKTNTASKGYDGEQLVGTAEVKGLVDGERATATATTIGPDVTAKTENAVTGEIAWAEGTNSANYKRGTDEIGKLEIYKKDASKYTASVSITDWTYDGQFDSAHTLTSSNSAGTEQVTYTYYKKDGENWIKLDAAPVDAGSYKVVANWAETDNYPALSAECEFTVAKRAITVTGNYSKTYTGKEQTVEIKASDTDHVTVTGGLVDPEKTVLSLSGATISGTKVGEYKTVASGYTWNIKNDGTDVSDNYTVTVNGTLTITKKDDLTLNANGYSGTYDGDSHKGTVTVSDTVDTTIEYSTDDGEHWSTDAPTITDVERADGAVSKIHVKVRAYNPNYESDSVEKALIKEYDLEVLPRTITVKAEDERVYNGTDQTLTITTDDVEAATDTTGLVSDEALTLDGATITGCSVDEYTNVATYTWSVAKGDEAKTDSTGNYTIAVTGKLTITPKSIKPDSESGMTVTAPNDVVYNGETHKLAPTVKDGKTKLTEDTDYELSYSKDLVNAGKVTITVKGKGNYSSEITVTYNITPRAVTLTSKSATKPYDGTELTRPNVTGWNQDGDTGFVTGEVSDVKATGTVTNYNDPANSVEKNNTITYTEGKNFKASNYTITKDEGTLRITKLAAANLNLTGKDVTAVYDGQAHTAGTATAKPKDNDGKELKVTVTIEYSADNTNWVTDPAKISATDVADSKTVYVRASSANFEGYVTGTETLTIKKREVTVTSADANKVYDGTPLTKHEASVSPATGLVTGETLAYSYTGSRTEVGREAGNNTFTVDWDNSTAVSGNYTVTCVPGTLTVTAQSIVPSTDPENPDPAYKGVTVDYPSDTTYNGEEHKWVPTVKAADGKTLLEIDKDYTVTYKRSYNVTEDFTNAGYITVVIAGTGNYSGEATRTYEIKKREITITSDNGDFVYNGTSQKKESARVTSGEFVTGQGVKSYTYTKSVKNVGDKADNEFTYVLNDKTSADNYEITTVFGKLTVLKSEESIVVTLNDYTGVYDGQEHKATSNVAGKLPDGFTTKVVSNAAITNVGETTAKIDSFVIYDTDGKDVTDQFEDITTTDTATLTVTKREVTVTSADATKVYDGTALSKHEASVTSLIGLVGKETLAYSYTGSQTEVGGKVGNNTFTVDWKKSTALEGNYTVECVAGTLTVTKQSIKPSTDPKNPDPAYKGVAINSPSDSTYDANAHKWAPTVTDAKGNELVADTDYTVTYKRGNVETKDFTNVGTITVVITGKGNYSGTVERTYEITPASVTLKSNTREFVYNGSDQGDSEVTGTGAFKLFESQTALLAATGKVHNVDDTALNTIKYTMATGFDANNYTITLDEGKLSVTAKSIETGDDMDVSKLEDLVYTGLSQEQKPDVTDGNTALVEDKDYDVTFSEDTVNVGKVTVTVTGKGNYTGKVERTYRITPAPLTVTTEGATKVYDGTPLTNENGSIEGLVNGETATVVTNGSQTKVGTSQNGYTIEWDTAVESNYKIVSDKLGDLTVTPQSIDPGTDPENPDPAYKGIEINDPSNPVYDGTEHKWTPVVKDADGNELVEGTDYDVTYDTSDFVNTGTITVTITGKGEYTGTVTKTYRITPAALHVVTASASKTYDGSALTSTTVTVTGLVKGDEIVVTATGAQTQVGSSENTYSIDWQQVSKDNYTITDELGTLTVTVAPAPAPDNGGNTPTTPTTPSNNNGGSIIDTIVDGMDDAYRTITGDTEDDEKKDEEKITDDETPLANLDKKRDTCWVHWYMTVCALATVVYGIFVGMRRTKHTRRLEDDLNDILNNDESKN